MKNSSTQAAKRDSFASSFGVLVAMAGSAVGLGNLWRFPYLVGENGGAAFILIYLGFVVLAGLPVMLAVFAFGISPGEGPDLVFVTLPHIFSQMPLGGVIAIFFFVAPAALLAIAFFQIHE